MDLLKKEWNPRFVVFARSLGKTPEEMPRGFGPDFALFIAQNLREYNGNKPIQNQDDFTSFLERKYP